MRASLPVFILLSVASQAQIWCPPGATWNYAIQAFATDGYVVRTYVGDTVVDGWNAQKIHEGGQQIIYWSGDTIQINSIALTSVQDSIVYLRTASWGTPIWDTLFMFNASIGDRWFPPGADSVCSNGLEGMLEVVDTGSIVVNGIDLRKWSLAYLDAAGDPVWGAFDVVERLGSLYGLNILPGACIIVEYGELLRCYEDVDLHYSLPSWTYGCSSTTSIADRNTQNGQISPNPGTDQCVLTLPPGECLVRLYDATGREMLVQRTQGGNVTISTAHLPSGLYMVRVDDGPPVRWVKE